MDSYQQMYVPKMSRLNKMILIGCVAVFILQSICKLVGSFSLESVLGLSQLFFSGHLYQLLTYPFAQSGPMSLVFDGLILWFIGSEFEGNWGTKLYAQFLIFATLGGALFYLLINGLFFSLSVPFVGLQGICYALLLSYALIYPDRYFSFMFIIPVKAKYFCMILAGLEFYSGLFSPYGRSGWGHLGAAFSAYIFLNLWVRMKNRSSNSIFKANVFSSFPRPSSKNKGNLRLVNNDKDSQKRYWH